MTITVYDINACDITAIVLCDIQLPVDINTYDIVIIRGYHYINTYDIQARVHTVISHTHIAG